jgi:hypothetical protein
MTNGNESRIFCRDNPAMLGPTARITAFLLKRFYSVIGPESHGETFLNVSEIFVSFTLASPVGAKPESGNVSSKRWRKTPTTNMP